MNFKKQTEKDREDWYQLACEAGAIFEDFGHENWLELPKPIGKETRCAVRYIDTWQFFLGKYSKEVDNLLTKWSCYYTFPENLSEAHKYLIQLRSFIVARFIENLYVGPGKHGYSYIPFPRDVSRHALLQWWLVPWFEDKGQDVLYGEMRRNFWSGNPRKFAYHSPKWRKLSLKGTCRVISAEEVSAQNNRADILKNKV